MGVLKPMNLSNYCFNKFQYSLPAKPPSGLIGMPGPGRRFKDLDQSRQPRPALPAPEESYYTCLRINPFLRGFLCLNYLLLELLLRPYDKERFIMLYLRLRS